MSPLRSGLAVLPLALTQVAAARTAPRLLARAGPKPVTVAGTTLIAAAMTWLSRITPASGYLPGVLGPMVLFGTGIGLCFMPLNMMIIAGVPRGDSGAVSGTIFCLCALILAVTVIQSPRRGQDHLPVSRVL